MHHQGVDACALDRAGEGLERLLGVLLVDADTTFDVTGIITCAFTAATQSPTWPGFRHQAGAERPPAPDPTGQPTLRLTSS